MAINKIKISELPLSKTLVGLHTIGVDAQNKSVKVGLEFVKTAADNADSAATKALNATVDARSISSIAVDKIRETDMDSEGGTSYSLISMNRARNYSYFIGSQCLPLMPVFECKYEPGNPARITSKWSIADDTSVIVTATAENKQLTSPIRVTVADIMIPYINIDTKRELYIRELNNRAIVTLIQLDESRTLINTKTYSVENKACKYLLDVRTRVVSLIVEYSIINWCTRLSVYCTGIGYDLFFNKPDDAFKSNLKGMLLRKSQTDKYDIIPVRDGVRYIYEKSARRIFDRAECRVVKEDIDVSNYVKVLFGDKITNGNDPYSAINDFGETPNCGRIGIFIHKKWRQRTYNRFELKGVPGSSRYMSKYALANRSIDKLPLASDANKMIKGSVTSGPILRHYYTHADRQGSLNFRSVRYIQCFVSVYKITSPKKDERGQKQKKIPIGKRIYFRLCNRRVINVEGVKSRVWLIEE